MKSFSFSLSLSFIFLFTSIHSSVFAQSQNQKEYERDYREYVSTLASDDFQGRKPFTKGEELTVNYLKAQFQKIGTEPGKGNSYFQDVPMMDILTRVKGNHLEFKGKNKSMELESLSDFVVQMRRGVTEEEIQNAPLVFAGFGIDAPEFGWNDFNGLDAKGKILVVMVNDPGFYNPDLFQGKDMTYYGRWTYKYEEAQRKGALGVLIIHQTDPASYGWEVVRSSWGGSNLFLQTPDDNKDASALEGWITEESAKKIFELGGFNLEEMMEKAKVPGFKPVNLGVSLSGTLQNKIEKKLSKNVIAMIPGTDLKDEYIIYTAHWDHFGLGEPVDGDSIYNGAADNASGTAGLLVLAKMFKDNPPVRRTVVFLAVTAEEQGLLGSEYYTAHPIFPLKKTVANINIDVLQPFGKMKDLVLVGKGLSDIDNWLIEVADEMGRTVKESPFKSGGGYYRSDHFNFAKSGIPTLYTGGGSESLEHGLEWGMKQRRNYGRNHYHRPSDEYSPDWDVTGSIWDLELLYKTGRNLGNSAVFPQWNEGVMFKKIRENGE